MRNDMYEGKWSPFDPKWYQKAFDRYTSTADQLFNQDFIRQQGFHVPDADGSKSSIFRNEAVLNNSFNEQYLRDTLKDIYLNSTHHLKASNHDNTHFFQWHGHMSDMTIISNTNQCEFTIPTETFLNPKEKDQFKRSQFSRKWVKVEDILNNWQIFKWHCFLFINQKIYSEYELLIDDLETKIRFPYLDYWVQQDFPVYIYKMDTNAQCRVMVTRELIANQWNWKIPTEYITDPRVNNRRNLMVAFNKINDQSIRTDGLTHNEVLGDNLEFLVNEDGYIDLTNISAFNRRYIMSESSWMWMSIIVPKFFHEYPILLPTDVVYRPYEANFQPVKIRKYNHHQNVKTRYSQNGEFKQIYVDMNGHLKDEHDGWKEMIRPIVLSDAYEESNDVPYDELVTELNHLRKLTVEGADLVEMARFDITPDHPDMFQNSLLSMRSKFEEIHEAHRAFQKKKLMEEDHDYEKKYDRVMELIHQLQETGYDPDYFETRTQDTENNFWFIVSPMIHIPRALADRYLFIDIISGMGHLRNLWVDGNSLSGRVRFQRPIDESDFWTFEYNADEQVWRPYPLKIEHHFPDVYLVTDPTEETPTLNRVFKTFIFYSDTMNVREESREITRASAEWDKDVEEYHYDQEAVYRDIFMEKFYWMGVRSIYRGILRTQCRWEILEYIIDNPSYQRFNDLFLQTMDPYFKLGLATYLKSNNYEFPFDDAIAKMQEAVGQTWLGYQKITNFEMYLNKTWIPSYFDYITKIMDNWQYEHRLVKRPRRTFDIHRLYPTMLDVQKEVDSIVNTLNQDVEWLLNHLSQESYNLDVDRIRALKNQTQSIYSNIHQLYKFMLSLDLPIYSIDDINFMIQSVKDHERLILDLEKKLSEIHQDVEENNIYEKKVGLLEMISASVEGLPERIDEISRIVNSFDMDGFMKAVNDLAGYFEYPKYNPDDKSLIGKINEFNSSWSDMVKERRNKLFVSTTILNGIYDPMKTYSEEEVTLFNETVVEVRDNIKGLRNGIVEFWRNYQLEQDQTIIDCLDYSESFLEKLYDSMNQYLEARNNIIAVFTNLRNLLSEITEDEISETELGYRNRIIEEIEVMIQTLSYVAGKNHKLEAIEAVDQIKTVILSWSSFLNQEAEVFELLLKITKPPIDFLNTLYNRMDILEAICEYMDTVNTPFVPDKSWPTYSDIFEVNEVELISGGFHHKNGEILYVPKMGVYQIQECDGDVAKAIKIDPVNVRTTNFRDPMSQTNPYDSVTNGAGLGITIRPISSTHTIIKNDTVVLNYMERIQSVMTLIQETIQNPNPYENVNYLNQLDVVQKIQADWEYLLSFYRPYMTENTIRLFGQLISSLEKLYDPSRTFIEEREKIDLSGIMILYQRFIFESYDYIEDLGKQNQTFFYYDELLRNSYNSLLRFYGNGSGWTDSEELKHLLDQVRYPIKMYSKNILESLEETDTTKMIRGIYDSIFDRIEIALAAIEALPSSKTAVNSVLNELSEFIQELPDHYDHDLWYKIYHVSIAKDGKNYRVGDIVEIIPQLPTDILGNEIHDQEELIMNDRLFLQISAVDDKGAVTEVTTLMDYAIPYQIWGIRDVITRVGEGSGLAVDVYSKEVTLEDSILFEDQKSDKKKVSPFDENDLFQFKFENIHDLNMHYEVFLGGKQITDFVQRHEKGSNPLHPTNIDVLYLKANDVIGLQNSSIYIPADHYFVYRINNLNVIDPGAGYAEGQDIYVDTDQVMLRLKVVSLCCDPLKGIESVEVAEDGMSIFNGQNPTSGHAPVITDSLNNIDDEYNEGYYDHLTSDGIVKKATLSFSEEEYPFTSKRFDDLEDGLRNKNYMYPDIDAQTPTGDHEYHWYQGSRIDNSQHPMTDERIWNGIQNVVPPTDGIISDDKRFPTGKPPKGEYQEIQRQRIHSSIDEKNNDVNAFFDFSILNHNMIEGDLEVEHFVNLPRHIDDWPEGKVGKSVIVKTDETYGNHRTVYQIRTFVAAGFFVYDLPEIADYSWNSFDVDWMSIDWYPDLPCQKAQYPNADWYHAKLYKGIQRRITDGKEEHLVSIEKANMSTYIHDLTIDDLSVFNYTTKEWEDLSDESRWKLEKFNEPEANHFGFKLTMIDDSLNPYSYDMRLFLNKIPSNQIRNAALKRNAILEVSASIIGEVNKAAINKSINTGRHLRIRKLFPYEQKQSFVIGKTENGDPLGYEMDFILAQYLHFKNELHLEDVKIYNKSAGRYENILDPTMFEVRFKDDKTFNRGFETQTTITRMVIGKAGEGFVDGEAWAWNSEYGTHVFGRVTANTKDGGYLLTFEPLHAVNAPTEDVISLEFDVYQNNNQTEVQKATVVLEFQTKKVEVWGDGYIHNVRNPLAPLPKEFKVIAQYNLDGPGEYEIFISKTPKTWTFVEPKWMMSPTFHIPDHNVSRDTLYIMTDKGRFPLSNPSTGKPSIRVSETENGTDVTFLNLYRRYEHLEIRSLPYPQRSVYVQRKIPASGYIDLSGKINKPLNKKYFEFWVNGRLLFDEVTIITPTKIFLHGLSSLKNLEIIEINRDSNEYFSDEYLRVEKNVFGRPFPVWNYRTYLDDVLEGKLEGDNYTTEEQEFLLSPIWKQVEDSHPEFKNYPPNVDTEDDVLLRTNPEDYPISELEDASYQFLVIDQPTLGGRPIVERNLKFGHFGFTPITEDEITAMLNEEWKEEMAKYPQLTEHVVVDDADWYGKTTILYDEYGNVVHDINDAAYHVTDSNLLRINTRTKMTRIVKNEVNYDLS